MGLLRKAFNFATSPTTNLPSRVMKMASEHYSPANDANPTRLKGFMSGASEGLGNVLDDMTSPLSLISMAAGGAGLAGRAIKGAKAAKSIVSPSASVAEEIAPLAQRTSNSTRYHGLAPKSPMEYYSNPIAPYAEAYRKGGSIAGQTGRKADDVADMMARVKDAKKARAKLEGRE